MRPPGLPRMLKRFFSARHTGWIAAAHQGDALDLVHVSRDGSGRPQLHQAVRQAGVEGDLAARIASATRASGLRKGRHTWLLHGLDYQILQVDTPDVPEAEQRNALRWQLKDALQQRVEDSVFDLLPLPPPAHARGRPPALVIAAARAALAPVVQAFSAARLDLAAIDVPELALRNIAALHNTAPRGIVLLHFDADGGLLVVCHEGELVTSRRLDVSADQLALADDLRVSRYERLGLELQRSLDNFDRQYSHIPLERLVLSVPPEAASIIDFLASNLYIPVEPLDLGALMGGTGQLGACSLLTLGAALRSEPA